MPDPFERARRELERAARELERHTRGVDIAFDRAARQFRLHIPDVKAIVEAQLAEAIGRAHSSHRRPPRGSIHRRRPYDPGPSPMPAPVRPKNPKTLSGGAEAPLDP